MVVYFARIHKNNVGQYEVSFPDLEPYAATYGNTLDEAIDSAHEALTGYLLTAKETGEKVANPSSYEKLKVNLSDGDLLQAVKVSLK
jgi:predicted RNase H-like HicB family nuclease